MTIQGGLHRGEGRQMRADVRRMLVHRSRQLFVVDARNGHRVLGGSFLQTREKLLLRIDAQCSSVQMVIVSPDDTFTKGSHTRTAQLTREKRRACWAVLCFRSLTACRSMTSSHRDYHVDACIDGHREECTVSLSAWFSGRRWARVTKKTNWTSCSLHFSDCCSTRRTTDCSHRSSFPIHV